MLLPLAAVVAASGQAVVAGQIEEVASGPWVAVHRGLASRAAASAAAAAAAVVGGGALAVGGPVVPASGSDNASRRLDASTISEMRHNGTHMERIVHARWQCTFPEGKCFKNHAPLEGMPEKMEKCTKETNKGPLEVEMSIDLTCAGMGAHIQCDKLHSQEFDPFQMCNNDPLLVKARCRIECRDGKPYEICNFDFDSGRMYNMSDETVDSCNLEAICKSPYVEQNEMFCSGHHTTGQHKPHWMTEDRPWAHREQHGLEAPPPSSVGFTVQARPEQLPPVPRTLPQGASNAAGVSSRQKWNLWTMALLLLLVAVALGAARRGWLPEPLLRFLEALGWQLDHDAARELPHSGASYRGPRARDRAMRYIAPSAPGMHGKSVPGGEAEEGPCLGSGT